MDATTFERGLRRVAENRIQTALAQGEFDDLPGAGKPMPQDRQLDADPAWRVAQRILDAAGFAPVWLELDQEAEGPGASRT